MCVCVRGGGALLSVCQLGGQIPDSIDSHIEQIIIEQLIIDPTQIIEKSKTPLLPRLTSTIDVFSLKFPSFPPSSTVPPLDPRSRFVPRVRLGLSFYFQQRHLGSISIFFNKQQGWFYAALPHHLGLNVMETFLICTSFVLWQNLWTVPRHFDGKLAADESA